MLFRLGIRGAEQPEPIRVSVRIAMIVVAVGLGIGVAVAAFLAVIAASAPDSAALRDAVVTEANGDVRRSATCI